jgi:very-short-patch-repair endonuclease
LLSYYNQRLHRHLDRRTIAPILAAWQRASFQGSAALAPRSEHVERLLLLAQSDLERRFVRLLDDRGHRLPSTAQLALPRLEARADFAYEAECVLVFVDGPNHDPMAARAADADMDDRLTDAGFTVLRFRHDEDWAMKLAASGSIFGRPASSRPPRA